MPTTEVGRCCRQGYSGNSRPILAWRTSPGRYREANNVALRHRVAFVRTRCRSRWGDVSGSNRRLPVPQTGALPLS